MSRSEQLRQLGLQLASLASLEDVVTHSRSRSPLPKSRGSILLSQRGANGLAVKSCLPAAPGALRLPTPASASVPKEATGVSSSARGPSLPSPRAAAADPRESAARLAGRRSSGAAEAERCSRDKRQRRTRRHSKRSMWREI